MRARAAIGMAAVVVGLAGCGASRPALPAGPSKGVRISRRFKVAYTVGEVCSLHDQESYMDVAALRCIDGRLQAMSRVGSGA